MKPAQTQQDKLLIFSGGPLENFKGFRGSFSKIKREIINLFVKNEYKKVEDFLSSTLPESKTRFFESEGYEILHYAVVTSSDLDPIFLITKNAPKNIVQMLLRDNEFEILGDLFNRQRAVEVYATAYYSEEEEAQKKSLFNQKIRLIHEIDDQVLPEFLSRSAGKKYMSESIIQLVSAVVPMETERRFSPPSAE